MVKFIFLTWAVIAFLLFSFSSCDRKASNERVIRSLEKISLFTSSNDMDSVNTGRVENSRVLLTFESISQEALFSVLNNMKEDVPYFTNEVRLGEKYGDNSSRNGDTLFLYDEDEKYIFIDRHERPKERYFFQGKIGSLFVIKKNSFENAETIFIGNDCKGVSAQGISSTLDEKKEIIFSTENLQEFKWDSTKVTLVKLKGCQFDTLISYNPNWFSMFSFFYEGNLYFARTKVNDEGRYDVDPMRMTIEIKN